MTMAVVVVEVDVALGEGVVVVEDSTETQPTMKMVAGMDSLIVTRHLKMVKRQLKGVVMVLPVDLSVVLVVQALAMVKLKKGNDPEEYMNAAAELGVEMSLSARGQVVGTGVHLVMKMPRMWKSLLLKTRRMLLQSNNWERMELSMITTKPRRL